MRAKVAQHKDISTVMLIALAAVLTYTLFGVFVMHQQAEKEAAAQAAAQYASNL